MAMTAWFAKFFTRSICLLRERAHLLPIDADHADQVVVLEHWHANHRSRAAEFSWSAWDSISREISDVAHLLCSYDIIQHTARHWPKPPALPFVFGIFPWRINFRCYLGSLTIKVHQDPEFGIANARCILQHGAENWLKLTWRRADDAQYLGGCILALYRFA